MDVTLARDHPVQQTLPASLLRLGPLVGIGAVPLAVVAARAAGGPWADGALLRIWSTMFVSVCLQALPFLVFGTTVSGALAALLPPGVAGRLLPRRPALAVPVAAVAGIGLPGCECGSVPVAGRLIACGAPAPAALAFLLAAPAVNPVVLVATAVAFPGRPELVAARFLASLLTAVVVGWLWLVFGRADLVERCRRRPPSGSRSEVFRATAVHDLVHAGGYLVVGGLAAATIRTVVPPGVLDSVSGAGPLAVLTLAGLAVVLSVCSEADAFVAVGLTQFSPTARLAFLVVGPVVDLKLVALHTGTFGPAFARRFVPLCFVVALTLAVVIGAVVL